MPGDRRKGSENAFVRDLRDLQGRLELALRPLPVHARDLREDVASVLRRAVLSEVLRNGEYDVANLLRLSEGTPSDTGTVFTLTGGPKEFARPTVSVNAREHFVRDDDAVIHFALTLRERHDIPLELIAYGFEIYFPSKEPIWFVRFDLNKRGDENAEFGLRSHLHPGHEDLQLPSPLLSPVEALNFVLYRCRLHRGVSRT